MSRGGGVQEKRTSPGEGREDLTGRSHCAAAGGSDQHVT